MFKELLILKGVPDKFRKHPTALEGLEELYSADKITAECFSEMKKLEKELSEILVEQSE